MWAGELNQTIAISVKCKHGDLNRTPKLIMYHVTKGDRDSWTRVPVCPRPFEMLDLVVIKFPDRVNENLSLDIANHKSKTIHI